MSKAVTPKPKSRPVKKKYVESPEKLWELFCAYRKEIKKKPIKKHDYVGGFGKSVYRKIERPLTMEGFENFCFEAKVIADLKNYFADTGGSYEAYRPICARIREIIRADQIEGGMAGIYNPSITQRLNNLVEKTQTTITEQPLFPDAK